MNNVPKIVGDSETNSEIKKVRTMIEESFGKKIQNITSEEIIKKIPKKSQKKFAIYYTKRAVVKFIAELLSSFKISCVQTSSISIFEFILVSILSNVLDNCDGILIPFEVAIFIVSKNLYGCAVLRIKVSEPLLIFFAAPTAVAV